MNSYTIFFTAPTTIESEEVPRDDNPINTGRRTQKVYQDVLGRTWKTVVMNWDGVTPYTTTVQGFNGRDQVFRTRQYAGATSGSTFQTVSSSAAYQDVTMTYDGHGRLKTRRYPIENTGTNTTYSYNADDTIQQIIDPRGAITNFTYDSQRGLLTNVSYQVPSGSGIPVAPSVGFSYDALGNRTQMTDGTGTTDYSYDALSRLVGESKSFTDLPNAPVPNNKYTIGYSYNLSGGLQSVTDPFGDTVSYTHDRTGRLTKVAGTPYTHNPTGNYADGIKYRAFGAIKQIDYKLPDETPQIKMDYDERLRVSHFETTSANETSGYLMRADFGYFADSRNASKNDLLDDKFDRLNKFDFAGRLNFNQFGMGINSEQMSVRVYEETITYDGFSMMTGRSGEHWGSDIGYSESYVNGRIANFSGTYDAAGNIVFTGDLYSDPHSYRQTTFDAAGRQTKYFSREKGRAGSLLNMITEQQTEHSFDGDGRPVKEAFGVNRFHMNDPQPQMTTAVKAYQIWSTVLGSSLTTIKPDGTKQETKIFAGSSVIAKQTRYTAGGQNYDAVEWMTTDPVSGSEGVFRYDDFGASRKTTEREPLGQKVLPNDPAELPEPPPNEIASHWEDMQWQCEMPDEFYGGFQNLPHHCQMNRLKSFGVFSDIPLPRANQ